MSFRVQLTAEALHNQNEIADWIAQRSVVGALSWLDALDRVLLQLWLGTFAGVAGTLIAFLAPLEIQDSQTKWGLRCVFLGFTTLVAYNLFKSDSTPYLQAKGGVPPLPKNNCPYCNDDLGQISPPFCHRCNVSVQ